MKKYSAFIAVLMLIGAMGFALNMTSASAVEPCVPSDAWTETIEHPAVTHDEVITVVDKEAWTEVIPAVAAQHYSWVGKKLGVGTPPRDIPPSGNWQANTSQEPHQHATWVNDSLHYMANSQGFASWFYYIHPVEEQVIEHEAVTHEETITVVDEEAWTETIEHEAVTCDETDSPIDECIGENGEDLCSHEESEDDDSWDDGGVCYDDPCGTVKDAEEKSGERCFRSGDDIICSGQPGDETGQKCFVSGDDVICSGQPGDETDPVINVETRSSVDKVVKIKTHESGEVTREVTHYDMSELQEEGL